MTTSVLLRFAIFLRAYFVCGKSLLLIGDSVDRFITVEWCDMAYGLNRYSSSLNKRSSNIWAVNHPHIIRWATHTITSNDDPYFFCVDPSNSSSIANVHMLGSAPKGPYYHDKVNLVGNSFRDSAVRVEKAIQLYISSFGRPSRVVLNTVLWDVLGAIERYTVKGGRGGSDPLLAHQGGSTQFNTSVSKFWRHQLDRLDQLNMLLNQAYPYLEPVDISLRTAAWTDAGGGLLRRFNDIIRQIATTRQLTLYDFDKDVYSTVISAGNTLSAAAVHERLFRDWIHPRHYYTSMAGDKLLGRRFSQYFLEKGRRRTDPFLSVSKSRGFHNIRGSSSSNNTVSSDGENAMRKIVATAGAGCELPSSAFSAVVLGGQSLHKTLSSPPSRNSSRSRSYQHDVDISNSPLVPEVSLIRCCGRLYYVNYVTTKSSRERVRWLVEDAQVQGFLGFMRLGEGDIYHVSNDSTSQSAEAVMSLLPPILFGTLPPIFNNGYNGYNSSNMKDDPRPSCVVITGTSPPLTYYISPKLTFKQVPNEKACIDTFGVDRGRVYKDFYQQWIPNWNIEDPLLNQHI